MIDSQITDLETRAKQAGIKMAPVLIEVGVSPVTWWRWRKGHIDPKLGTIRKVEAELERRIVLKKASAA